MHLNILQVVFLSTWGAVLFLSDWKLWKFPGPFNATRMELWSLFQLSRVPAAKPNSRLEPYILNSPEPKRATVWPFVPAFSRPTKKTSQTTRLLTYRSTVQPIKGGSFVTFFVFFKEIHLTGAKKDSLT